MSLFFQEKELSELMQSFYLLTDIKIVLFDKDYNYFLRTFKKAFGISPKKMMKTYKL